MVTIESFMMSIISPIQISISRDSPIVDFLVMGTQKGGTTSLHSILRQHPDLLLPTVKELHFFDRSKYFLPSPTYRHYHAYFHKEYIAAKNNLKHKGMPFIDFLKGEVTPSYMYWKPALDRIYAYNPNIKMIFILRHPIERAASHYAMEVARNLELGSFSEAIRAEVTRLTKRPNRQHRIFSYVARSKYGAQIERILTKFSRGNMLLVKTEDFKTRFSYEVTRIQEFLGVRPLPLENRFLHTGTGHIPNFEDKAYLLNIFRPDIEKLERLTGLDCQDWKE